MKLGLIGDYQESVTAHQAIPLALELASNELSIDIEFDWIDSDKIELGELKQYSAIWCVPGSPYKHTENVLSSIEFARINDVPFLGTCGGYQHAALEFARNKLGYSEAENSEISPDTSMPLISGLSCKLYDEKAEIFLKENSKVLGIYNEAKISEEYFCGFGVNQNYLHIYENSEMYFCGFDADGDPRILEIKSNNFFIGTAFQPERSALNGLNHPLITAYLLAAKNT